MPPCPSRVARDRLAGERTWLGLGFGLGFAFGFGFGFGFGLGLGFGFGFGLGLDSPHLDVEGAVARLLLELRAVVGHGDGLQVDPHHALLEAVPPLHGEGAELVRRLHSVRARVRVRG